MKKKLIQFLICCIIISCLSVSSVWALIPNTTLSNITITFSDNSCFTDSEKYLIINSF
jgi:hypothetical protein